MVITVCKAIVFLCLEAGSYLLCRELWRNRVLQSATRRACERIARTAWERRKGHGRKGADGGDMDGGGGKEGFLTRMDRRLEYSGLREKLPFLSTEWFLVTLVAAGAAGYFLTFLLTRRFRLGLTAFFLVPALLYALETALCHRSYRRTEEQLLVFLNLLDSYSITAGELTGILLKTSKLLTEPLKGALEACYYEAQTSGDTNQALERLAYRVEHPKFRELIRNLEVCSRYDADYGSVVQDSRKGVQDFLAYRGKRRSLASVARVEMLFLAVTGVSVFAMMGGILQQDIWTLLFGTAAGRGLLLFQGGVLALFLWQILLFDKE